MQVRLETSLYHMYGQLFVEVRLETLIISRSEARNVLMP